MPPAGITEVPTTLNMFLRSLSTLLHWLLEIITKIPRKFFQRHVLPDYTGLVRERAPWAIHTTDKEQLVLNPGAV